MPKNNTGVDNTGNWNSGNWNSGNLNSGNWNSGNWNSSNLNSGHWNSGNWNSGNLNSGNWNSGNLNSGNWNSGNLNSGNWNSGAFNRDSQKMRLFEKDLDMTAEEFYDTYNLYMDLPLNVWVDKSKMTKEEKSENNGWETTGGFLRTLDYKEAHRKWWADNPNDHERFLSLPNFSWEIFTEITGIEQDSPKSAKKKQELLDKADELIKQANELKDKATEL
jgi:hypothetical protein